MSLAVVGCVNVATFPADPRPKPAAGERSAPELRIPDTAVARGPDIPLVPLPPVPRGRSEGTSAPAKALPAPPPAPTAKQLHQRAQAHYATIDSYIARLTRREVVKNKANPEEVLLFKFRKTPWSVYFKWLGKEGQGREAVYVKGRYEGKIHTLLAAGDVPFVPAGKRMAVAPDNVFVRSASRHPISEAGIGASIDRLGALIAAQERGDRRPGTLNVQANLKRPEFSKRVAAIEHVIPARAEAELPRGGRRLYCFCPECHLPLLIVTRDERGQEVEYYRYDRLQYPVKLDADDFDPDKLWGKPAAPARAPKR
jgi:hypothetical protein